VIWTLIAASMSVTRQGYAHVLYLVSMGYERGTCQCVESAGLSGGTGGSEQISNQQSMT
jgi:hypothetical protein